MKSEDKILELAKKLKTLSERGVGGEAVNSAEALQKLIEKYDIDVSLLTSEKPTPREIQYDARIPFNDDLAAQIIWKLLEEVGDKDRTMGQRRRRLRYGILYVDLTEGEYLETIMRVEHFQADLKKNLDAFFYAYMKTQKLLTKASGDAKELTEEEKEMLRKADRHQWGIEQNTPSKRLN